MDLCNYRRTFADAGGDALNRARAHVANGEDARPGGLERQGAFAGQDEAFGVGLDAADKPSGVGISADKQEQVPYGTALGRPVLAVAKENAGKPGLAVAFERGDFAADLDGAFGSARTRSIR